MYLTWNTVHHGRFYPPFENKDTLLLVEVFSELNYDFCYCDDIVVNQILKKYGHLVQ